MANSSGRNGGSKWRLPRQNTPVNFRQEIEFGRIQIDPIQVNPSLVNGGDQITIACEVRETTGFIGAHPDLCNPDDPISQSGLQVTVEANPDWTAGNNRVTCVPVHNFTAGQRTVSFTFTAPQVSSGSELHNIEITGRFEAADGSDSTTKTVEVVSEGGRDSCNNESDCGAGFECELGECVPENGGGNGNGGGDGPWLPCYIDPNADCGFVATAGWGLVGFIVLLSLLN